MNKRYEFSVEELANNAKGNPYQSNYEKKVENRTQKKFSPLAEKVVPVVFGQKKGTDAKFKITMRGKNEKNN